jgi:hypothetical protein
VSFESLQAAHDALAAALQAASDGLPAEHSFGVVQELADTIDPPAVVLAPPELDWTDAPIGTGPTSATWTAALVVGADDQRRAVLYRLLPVVTTALDGVADAVMRTGEPGTWQSGSTALPAYLLRVEVAL